MKYVEGHRLLYVRATYPNIMKKVKYYAKCECGETTSFGMAHEVRNEHKQHSNLFIKLKA